MIGKTSDVCTENLVEPDGAWYIDCMLEDCITPIGKENLHDAIEGHPGIPF
jgi:hypothetical protein